MLRRTAGLRQPLLNRRLRARPLAQAFLLLAGLPLFPAVRAHGQTFQARDPGTGSVAVAGKWQFHTGDDLVWANPAYDGSSWEQLRGDEPWGAQTHPGYTGFAWYRKRIDVTGAGEKLAILIPPVDDAYEIYWNGKKIGTSGSLPPHARWWAVGHSTVYPLGNVTAQRRACIAGLESSPLLD